ncbi:MAG: 30S ribosome-binding factor RbfA [Chitinispirillaceae bacterium]|nr:30S ribosome-binding factor RbfA [Chitinispirillaceae bacterium]
MAAPHFHKERLAELMQREISAVIARELRDPRIPSVVTVAGIELSTDLRNATVYVSVFDAGIPAADAVKALNKAAPFVQRLLASRISIKHIPHLYFKQDKSIEQTLHINQLLKEIQDDVE